MPRVAVVGLGLVGASLAVALREAGTSTVTAWDVDDATRDAARRDGIAVATSVAEAVREAEVVVVAVPVDALGSVLHEVAAAVSPHAVVTDTASVKALPVEIARAAGLRFVAGHPMAGRETAGYRSASGSLFAGARWALCVETDTSIDDLLVVAALVHAAGAGVVPVTAAAHDHAVAVVSHLPHVLASSIAARALDDADRALLFGLAGGSFRDATRVARAPSALWSGVLRANAGVLAPLLEEHAAALERVAKLADAGDDDELQVFFDQGRTARERYEARTGVPATITLPADDAGARAVLLDLGRQGGAIAAVAPGRVIHARVPAPEAAGP